MSETPAAEEWFIATPAELAQVCTELAATAWLALDTEFERSRTFYAELCLVQIAAPAFICCIDPLALADLSPLTTLLTTHTGSKLLHAARQDLEVLYNLANAVPAGPLFDTQIAAALVGLADNIGYADLVQQLLGTTLDKSQTRTDWRQRPLTTEQRAYAADDVRYLAPVTSQLRERLARLGRTAWLAEDCEAQINPATYAQPVGSAWQRVKGIGALPPPAFARAVALATWREAAARERNLPRGWVLKDEELLHVALAAPTSARELAALAGGNAGALRRHGDAVIELLQGAATLAVPTPPRRLNAAGRAACKKLSTQAQTIAQELALAPTVVVTRRELEAVLCGDVPARLQTGWRRSVLAAIIDELPVGGDPIWWDV